MTTKRTAPWRYTGDRDGDGKPLAFYTGVPARDLDPDDIAALTDDEYAQVSAGVIYAHEAKAEAKADARAGKE